MSTDPIKFNQKLIESYLKQTEKEGVENESTDDTSILQGLLNQDEALFFEGDGDIFYTTKSGNNYITELLEAEDAQNILNSNNFNDYDIDVDNWINDIKTSATQMTYSNVKNILSTTQNDTTSTHRDGTGSTQSRLDALSETVANIPGASTFKDENGDISRDKIQEWLDENNYSTSENVEGGFNVDDILTYYSHSEATSSAERMYYHLLANEAWLDSGAYGNNEVDGKLSSKEIQNFYQDRFGIDVLSGEGYITESMVDKWREANKAVGNDLHDELTYVGVDNLTRVYDQYISKAADLSDSDSSYRYNDRTLSSSNFNSSSKISNVLDNLKNTKDFEATIEMNEDVELYDEYSDDYVTLSDGEKYEITKVEGDYVYIDVDGDTIKVKRGTSSDGFENKCRNAIEEMIYSADDRILSSSVSSPSYEYNDRTLSSSNFNTSSKISNVLDNLKNTKDFEATIEMNEDVELYDENSNDYVTLSDGEKYEITKVSGSYVYIDVDGETIKVKRGTSSSGFENKCRNAIEEMIYSADSKISSSSVSSSNSSYKYEDRTLSSSNFSTSSKISNVLDNLKNTSDFEATIEMNEDVELYDENSDDYVTLSDGEKYEITKVSGSYVYIDVDGETIKVKRGTSSSGFENKCRNAIEEMIYSADSKISSSSVSSSSSSSSSTSYNNYSLKNRTADDVEKMLDNMQNSDDYEGTITISNKNWFDEDGKTYLSVGEYEISNITSNYVYLTDEDGNSYKIPRGTDEYEFEWYCSKENTESTTRFTGSY